MKQLFIFLLLLSVSADAQEASQKPKGSWKMPKFDSMYLGKQYVDIDLTSLDGKPFTSSTLKGKVVFLSFWFEGCSGCRDEFNEINELYDSLKNDRSCVFMTLTFDDPKTLPAFIDQYGLHFPITTTCDHNAFVKMNYGMGCPSVIILDKDNLIAFIGMKRVTRNEVLGNFGVSISKAISIVRSLE